MKILIFGFGPYLSHKENISEKIIRRLKDRKDLQKVVLPVKFDDKIFLKAINKYKPDVVLGLGQHPRAYKIRIERKAFNRKRKNKKEKLTKIEKGGPVHMGVNLKLKPDNIGCISYDAGSYVCNFCMYIISRIAKSKNIKFAFLHVPQNYDIQKATRFIEVKITEIHKTHLEKIR